MHDSPNLREITRILREPGGCDWDRAQNEKTMRGHLIEEAYEAVSAVDGGKPEEIKEELGDLLFLIHFYSRLFEEKGGFTFDDVEKIVCEKLIRRHPHVFSTTQVEGVQDILKNWEEIKRKEKAQKQTAAPEAESSLLDHVEASLPALLRAMKIQEKASRAGFDWESRDGVIEKLREEIVELEERKSDDTQGLEEEAGDLLFAAVNLVRHLGLNPELALTKGIEKFSARFRRMEEMARKSGRPVQDHSAAELDTYWNHVKKQEKREKS